MASSLFALEMNSLQNSLRLCLGHPSLAINLFADAINLKPDVIWRLILLRLKEDLSFLSIFVPLFRLFYEIE